jgi:Fur family ferric uptake transcriptional regulator
MMDDLLIAKGLRLTNFRRQVLSIFFNSDKAIAVSELESELGEHDRITLYRTIKTFIDKGLIHEIVMPGDVKKLALCNASCGEHAGHHEHNHLHFQCKSCEEVFCVEVTSLPDIHLNDYQIDEFEIQAKGTCPKCKL